MYCPVDRSGVCVKVHAFDSRCKINRNVTSVVTKFCQNCRSSCAIRCINSVLGFWSIYILLQTIYVMLIIYNVYTTQGLFFCLQSLPLKQDTTYAYSKQLISYIKPGTLTVLLMNVEYHSYIVSYRYEIVQVYCKPDPKL